MSRTFNCPNCGAPLDYSGGSAPTIRCPFCNNSVIVPEELRAAPDASAGSVAGAVLLQPGKLRDIAEQIRAGNKIEAIKLYRQTFGVGLKEAKDAIEKLENGEAIQFSDVTITSPGTASIFQELPGTPRDSSNRSGGLPAGCIGLVVIVAIVFPILFAVLPLSAWDSVGMAIGLAQPTPTRTVLPTRVATTTPTPLPPTPSPTPGLASLAATFGEQGTGPGFLNDARSIAVDAAGRIYVADYTGGRVQAFDATGKFVTQWNVGNAKTTIYSLAASRQGTIYVVADGEIKRYEGANGKSLGSLQYPGGNRFDAIAVTGDGNIFAMWYEERFGLITGPQGHREDLVRFDSDGKVTKVFRGLVSEQSGYAEFDAKIAVDGLGNIFVLASNADQFIFSFTSDGKYVNKFSTRGDKPGQLNFPQAITLDGQGRLYIADSDGVHVFESNGQFVDVFKADSSISQMVFNDKNELFAVARTQVVKFALNRR